MNSCDPMKIENRSHKLDGSRSQRNQDVSISSDSVYDSVAYDVVKTGLWESKEPTNRKARNRAL